MSNTRRVHTALLVALLLAIIPGGALAPLAPPPALAQSVPATTTYFRYQGEPSSYDPHGNQQVNCGPTSVAMAIQYAQNVSVPIREIRAIIGKNSRYTEQGDLQRALSKWGVQYTSNVVDAASLRSIVARGNIAIVALDMRKVSRGRDVNGASTDPTVRTGRFETYADLHWLVVKGVSADGKYFVVYDGNVWGGPNNGTYWYSDGTPKGLDRLYLQSEVEAGMAVFGGRNYSKGVEIAATGRPSVAAGQRVRATITHYSLTPDQTGKQPDDPAYGIMFNGNYVHDGAVAVDPKYIPLGTKMQIEGYGEKVFTAEDTGSAVKGWHVDVYVDGTKEKALRRNDTHGGTRTVTLLGPAPAFTDRAPSSPPVEGRVAVKRAEGQSLTRWVNLDLAAQDPEERVTGMMVSNAEDFTDAFEEPYAAKKPWTLTPGDGEKTVYARFKNSMGAWSEAVEAKVSLEERPPFGYVTVAPDPRVILAAPLSGGTLPAVGAPARETGRPLFQPLGPNLLRNSSFELWAGGIPEGWDSALRERSSTAYEPSTEVFHGELGLLSATTEDGDELVQKVVLKPSTRYTLSARVRGRNGTIAVEELETQGVSSRSLVEHTAASKGGVEGWEPLRLSFETRANTTDALVRISGFDVLWDALQLEEGERPGVYRADGVLLDGAATNLVANPSMEVDAAGWSGLNSFVGVVSSPDYARSGRKALAVEKQKEGRAATFHVARVTPGETYTFSVYARLDAGGALNAGRLRGWYYEGADAADRVDLTRMTDANRPEMRWKSVGGGWYRGSYRVKATQDIGLYGVVTPEDVPVGDTYYLDAAQLEAGAHVTSYVDGSLGEGYAWTSEGHASPATRAPFSASYGSAEGARGSVLLWARPTEGAPDGAVLASLGSYSLSVRGGALALDVAGKRVGSAPWRVGEAHAYAVVWDGQQARLSFDGRVVGSAKAPAPAPKSRLLLGPGDEGAYPSAVVSDLSLWRAALREPEVRYIARNSPFDAGLREVDTRKATVATAASDATEGDITIEWSRDGRRWESWGARQGLRNVDLGPERGEKTVWVRYTDAAGNWLVYADQVVLVLSGARVAGGGSTTDRVAATAPGTRVSPTALDGLGAERAGWEGKHGKPSRNAGEYLEYADGRYSVAYAGTKLRHVERRYAGGRGPAVERVRQEVVALLPGDARRVRQYVPLDEWVVEVYVSASLRKRFAPGAETDALWAGTAPGTITVLYRVEDGRTTSVSVDAGASS